MTTALMTILAGLLIAALAGLFNFARLNPKRYRSQVRSLLMRGAGVLMIAALFLLFAAPALSGVTPYAFWLALLVLGYSASLPLLTRPFISASDSLPRQPHVATPTPGLPEGVSKEVATPSSKLVLLFLAANPSDSTQLALDVEMREIRAQIRGAEHRQHFTLETRWAVRPSDLQQALLELRPSILHFSGHGSASESIMLETDAGESAPISTKAVKELFSIVEGHLRLVVLNACFSRTQAREIVRHVDFAVGVKAAITDKAARIFSASFYRALAFGRTVDEAFRLGRNALQMELPSESELPELFRREGLDPDRGALFARSQKSLDHGRGEPTAPSAS